jgi:ABC-type phosphate transport system auxiliary subunit
MAYTTPLELYQSLESQVGKELATNISKSLEEAIAQIEAQTNTLSVQRKLELKDELTKELITKAEFHGEMKTLREEMRSLEARLKAEINNIDVRMQGTDSRLQAEMKGMDARFQSELKGLDARIQAEFKAIREEMKTLRVELDRKFTIMFVVLFFTTIFVNKETLSFFLRVIGVLK